MALPNMKTFCLATLKPHLRGILDYFKSESDYIIAAQETQNQKIASITADNGDLRSKLAETLSKLENVSGRLTNLSDEFQEASDFASLEASKTQIETNTASVKSIQKTLQNIQSSLTALTKDVTNLTKDVSTLKTNVNKVTANVLTNSNDITDIMTTAANFKLSPTPNRDGGMWRDDNYTPIVNEYNMIDFVKKD